MIQVLRAIALSISLSLLAFASTSFGDNPGTIPFGEPVFSGTGCPRGTASYLATEDALTVLFDSYTAEWGPGISYREHFKNCRVEIPLTIPRGWTALVESVDYRGFAELESKTRLFFHSWFRLGHWQFGTSRATSFVGPVDVDIFRRDSSRWKLRRLPCGRSTKLFLYSHAWVTGVRRQKAFFTLDSLNTVVDFRLKWQQCGR